MQRPASQKAIMLSVISFKVFPFINYLLFKTIMIYKSNCTGAILMASQTLSSPQVNLLIQLLQGRTTKQ